MTVVNEYSSLVSLIPFGGLGFSIVSEGFGNFKACCCSQLNFYVVCCR